MAIINGQSAYFKALVYCKKQKNKKKGKLVMSYAKRKLRVIAFALIAVLFTSMIPVNIYALGEAEPNDTVQKAVKLMFDTDYAGKISGAGDQDFYKISVPQNGYLVLNTEIKDNAFSFTLSETGKLDSRDNILYQAVFDKTITRGKLSSPKIGVKKGTYYLKITKDTGTNFKGAGYKFKINYKSNPFEKEPNDVYSKTKDKLENGTTLYGSIKIGKGDEDWYKMNVPKDGMITLTMSKTGKNTPKIAIYNRNRTEVYDSHAFTKDETKYTTYPIGLKRGTYYVKVYDGALNATMANEYALTLKFAQSEVWEKEFNNTLKTATKAKPSTWYSGSMKPGKNVDSDFYEVKISKAAEYTVNMVYPDNIPNAVYVLSLYDRKENALVNKGVVKKEYNPRNISGDWIINAKTKEKKTSPVYLEKGTYYLKVTALDHTADGKIYKLCVSGGQVVSSIAKASVSKVKDVDFTGKAHTPAITVELNREKLRKGIDYEVAYKNNTNPGTAIITITGKGAYFGTITKTFVINPKPIRLAGSNRFKTAYSIVNEVKRLNGNKKFKTLIVASGTGYPDALSGAYLAKVKGGAVILTSKAEEPTTVNYIKSSLAQGGTVYILGGYGAVPKTLDAKLNSNKIKNVRLKGASRYETNVSVLKNSGIKGQDLIVTTGSDFPDALIASSTGRPVMLVGQKLTDSQKALLKNNKVKSITVISTGTVVPTSIDSELKKASGVSVSRVTGMSKYHVSKAVADRYFKTTKNVVLATGESFPDALAGGTLAIKINAPILLISKGDKKYASQYIKNKKVRQGYVLGGKSAIPEVTISGLLYK